LAVVGCDGVREAGDVDASGRCSVRWWRRAAVVFLAVVFLTAVAFPGRTFLAAVALAAVVRLAGAPS
jgi:hypothetical protein